ncbi:MAG: TonB-dependent receptor [Paludibacter sp.]|nr:TonB-dependent receptor [Paludibacter sp.]
MKLFTTLITFLLFVNILPAQTKYTLSGVVSDKENGETLPGASVTVTELPGSGVSTNAYGYFALTLPEGNYRIRVSYLGFNVSEFNLSLDTNIVHNFRMQPQITVLKEVEVLSVQRNNNITSDEIGVQKLQVKEIKNIPVFFGEHDIMKTLSLTPGTKSIREGNGGLYVRGGSSSHNLIMLDEATVYYPHHLLGFFSTFNSDAIKDITLYKGTAPAEYGGRISSVMDIRMKDGNNQHFGVNGGIGLIASRLTLEGPIVKDRGSFLLSARRTYIDMLLKLVPDPAINSNTLNFYDLNAKLNFKINDRNRIYLSVYSGRDAFGVPDRMGLDWGNRTATVRWNHLWTDKLFSNTSLIYSDFDYEVDMFFDASEFSILSKIQNYTFRHEFQFFVTDRNTLSFGYTTSNHTITPGQLKAGEGATIQPVKIQDRYSKEQVFFISNQIRPTYNWNISLGLRMNIYDVYGPGDFYTYKNGVITDTETFAEGKKVKAYRYPERRLNLSYIINNQQSFKFSYASNMQNIHMISTSSASLPVDIWIMSGNNVRPQISDQFTLGYYRNFNDNKIHFSAETYIKWMQNQADLKNGADILSNEHIERELLFGKGRAYGLELMLQKKYGKLNGWIGYTLSRTELSIPGINDGNWYPTRYDVTNDFSIVGIYDLSKYLTLSATWVYQTGNAVTFPTGKYEIDGVIKYYSDKRNGYRMPDYHRLDIGLTWNFKRRGKYDSSLNLSVYNAYARKNAFTIDFEPDPVDPDKTRAVMTYLFSAIPSITYNFSF